MVSKEGDEDLYVRLLKPTMEPFEVNTRDNLAAAILGEEWVAKAWISSVHLFYTIMALFWSGVIIGLLALVEVLPSYWALVGGLMWLPGLIIAGYFPLILPLVWNLLNRFDTL